MEYVSDYMLSPEESLELSSASENLIHSALDELFSELLVFGIGKSDLESLRSELFKDIEETYHEIINIRLEFEVGDYTVEWVQNRHLRVVFDANY